MLKLCTTRLLRRAAGPTCMLISSGAAPASSLLRSHLPHLAGTSYATACTRQCIQLRKLPWQGPLGSCVLQQHQHRAAHKASAQPHKSSGATTKELDKQHASTTGDHKATPLSSIGLDGNSDVQLLEKLLGSSWAVDTLNVTVPFVGSNNILSKVVGRSAGKLAGSGLRTAGIFVQIALGAGIIVAAARHNVPVFQLGRMAVNLLAGSVVGAVPVLGSFTRTAYNANQKNLRLLEKFVDPAKVDKHKSGSGGGGGSFLRRHKLLAVMAVPATAAAVTALGGWYFILHKVGLV